jgi:two-component system sensor histidine kinase/response regulator
VLLTSIDGINDAERLATEGFAACLAKPIRVSQLIECLDKVLAHSAAAWHLRTQPMLRQAHVAALGAARRYAGNVLVVDDNVVNQKVAQRFLERMGCEVTMAADGAEAVRLFETTRFDLVLMDVQMPIMDGYGASRRIREIERNRNVRTPIVALTADAMSGQMEKCAAAGMDDFLAKPIDAQRLQQILGQYLSAGRADEERQAAAV